MGINQIINAIENSSLPEVVKKKSISRIQDASETLGKMFEGLHYKPPVAHPEFNEEIARCAIRVITPVFQENSIPVPVGRQVYDNIYSSINR
jgi:hypothetical protein